MNNPLHILRIIDGKPGHEKQSQALIEGLSKFRTVQTTDFHYTTTQKALTSILFSSDIFNVRITPDLCIGVGHRTHLTVLAAKKKWQCKSVVIMNPSLPLGFFDCVITPAHDGFIESSKRLVTPVALAPEAITRNTTIDNETTGNITLEGKTLTKKPDSNFGLILLGGINQHYDWNIKIISDYIQTILNKTHNKKWKIANSRRTPDSDFEYLRTTLKHNSELEFSDYSVLEKNWLAQQLSQTNDIWVTADSASMLAEALNTQAQVGVINLSSKSDKNKLEKSRQFLVDKNLIGQVGGNIYQEAPIRDEPLNPHIEAAQKLLNLLNI